MKHRSLYFLTLLFIFILIEACNLNLFNKAKDNKNEDLLMAIAANQIVSEQYLLKIESIQPQNGTTINSNQSIIITFNKEVQQCGLMQEQPISQSITTVIISGKQITINPPGGNWGSSGQTLKITGGCSPTDGTVNAAISLNYTIN
ncbi:MAG: hypothetical protein KatS3mg129_2172 [Leptospiraceae bacterium]|nr:MAG: hypothetical protein KatS3mg129_2172 [Leptospiraceae bacterium]